MNLTHFLGHCNHRPPLSFLQFLSCFLLRSHEVSPLVQNFSVCNILLPVQTLRFLLFLFLQSRGAWEEVFWRIFLRLCNQRCLCMHWTLHYRCYTCMIWWLDLLYPMLSCLAKPNIPCLPRLLVDYAQFFAGRQQHRYLYGGFVRYLPCCSLWFPRVCFEASSLNQENFEKLLSCKIIEISIFMSVLYICSTHFSVNNFIF